MKRRPLLQSLPSEPLMQLAPPRAIVSPKLVALTLGAMVMFAGNSLLCRIALKTTTIDAINFTTIRILAGLVALLLIVNTQRGRADKAVAGDWPGALILVGYAFAFSFAYVSLSAGTGALLLVGGTQLAMIGYGLWSGERLQTLQTVGLVLALGGLAGLLLPGTSAPPLAGAGLMLTAGVAWGIYCLLGRGGPDPSQVNAGNFMRALPLAAFLSVVTLPWASIDAMGFMYAAVSGALTSGVGYVIWYTALRDMKAVSASVVQLSVPILAALGGVIFLAEPITLRLFLASLATLSGIAFVIFFGRSVRIPGTL